MRRTAIVGLLVAIGAAAGAWWWFTRAERARKPLALYGNVDLRQVQLAFNNSERISAVVAQEGDHVRRGQVLARLDQSRLEPQVAQAAAQAAAQRQVVERLHHGNRPEEIAQARAQVAAQDAIVEKLHNGSRPEEIAQARANVMAAQAGVVNARRRHQRLKSLSVVRLPDQSQVQAVSQEELDDARAALDEAQAEAQLRGNEAQLAFLRQQLADTQLMAPADAVVRTRLLEMGEMSSPQRPVFSLAIIDPKWIRAYVSETDIGKLRPGMTASVAVDSFPNRHFEGWVGFISPVAEFTPKAVQIEELRTSLVYEVRVFVKDPSDELRLGMPATVSFPADRRGPQALEGP